VEHGGDTDARAEMFGVGGDRENRLARCLEQQIVDHRFVLISEVSDSRPSLSACCLRSAWRSSGSVQGAKGTNRKRRRPLVQAADTWRARDPRAAHLARDRRPLDRVPFRLLARFSRLAQRMRLKFTTTVPWRQPTRHLGGSLVRQVDSQLVAPRQHMSLARSPTWTPACFAARLPLVRHAHLGNS
jgi:hypothetical protein